MSDQIPLHELNQPLFAALLPETFGEQAGASQKQKHTAKQLAKLKAAGVEDPYADPQATAAILAQ